MRFINLLLCKALSAFCLFCAEAVPAVKVPLPKPLHDYIVKLDKSTAGLQGGAVAVMYRGKVVYRKTFGKKRGAAGQITSKTLFPLASVSKPVTAAAVFLAVSRGKLDFNKRVTVECLRHEVSIGDILSHTTGYEFSESNLVEQAADRSALLRFIGDTQPVYPAGQGYRYSNMMFSLTKECLHENRMTLEDVIGELRQALRTRDIKLLNAAGTEDLAYPHSFAAKSKKNNHKSPSLPMPFPPKYPKFVTASAGIFASLDAMTEFYRLCFGYRPDLLSQELCAKMCAPVSENQDVFKWQLSWPVEERSLHSYYAYGWRVLKADGHEGKEMVFHGGFINGVRAFIGHIPFAEAGLIIMVNQDTRFAMEAGIDLWGAFLRG